LETVTFDGTKIALIVRGKINTNHEPGLLAQHADAILPDGSPIGFFGEGDGKSGSGASVGLGMEGVVYDYNLFLLIDSKKTNFRRSSTAWPPDKIWPLTRSLIGSNNRRAAVVNMYNRR
jgi:hypothetical protein